MEPQLYSFTYFLLYRLATRTLDSNALACGTGELQAYALPASVKSRPSIHSFRCAIHSSLTNPI